SPGGSRSPRGLLSTGWGGPSSIAERIGWSKLPRRMRGSNRRPRLAAFAAAVATLLALTVVLAPGPSSGPRRELAAVGSRYHVKVLRDTWGVPHVFGQRDADTAYGLAWAHA